MFSPAGPYVYLLAYIVVLYLRPHEYLPSLQGLPVVPVTLLTAFGSWLLLQPKNFEAPQHRLLPGLALAMVVSVAMTGWLGGAVKVFVDFVPTAMLFYVVATSVDTPAKLRAMAMTLTAVTAVIALHGIEQASSVQGKGWTGAELIAGRITYLGFLNDPNDLAMAFLITLPLTLCLARMTRSPLLAVLCWVSAGLVLYALYLCNSRGAMLALGTMLLVFIARRYGLLGGALVSPLLVAPFVLLAPSRVGEMSASEASAAGRLEAWYEGFGMFRSHPLFGVGKGMFVEHHELTAHNSFVLAIAELGVFGYFFWLSLLVISALMLYRLLLAEPAVPAPSPPRPALSPRRVEDESRALAPTWDELRPFASALVYSFIGALVSAYFLSRTYVAVLFLLLALIVAVFGIARAQWPDRIEPIRFGEWAIPILILELVSIGGLWVLTRLMLGLM